MSNDESAAFKASTGGRIIAKGAKSFGYKNVAIAESGGLIDLEGGVHFSPEAMKFIEATARMVNDSNDLPSADKETIISLLQSLLHQSKDSFPQVCERILSIASSTATLLPLLKVCLEKIWSVI
ncbi:hypothetical protein [Pantoea anthophila]|uniref:hypothetical protein n=1 Tax=Pantoea anthophila TaxID=470931 RepID=UPI0027839AF6|nr:hypothetical protein [Pantoea anthophila]MDQ1214572.1 hypothetical protein [Pantoea anthophila]